jgi:hypothetical protein
MVSVAAGTVLGAAPAPAQAPEPVVHMAITPAGGQVHQLSARESGVARLKVGNVEYGFRPTLRDAAPYTRIEVTAFRLDGPSERLGSVEVTKGAPAVDLKTTPAFKVAVTDVTPPPAPSPTP